MSGRMNWRKARERKGWSQQDVAFYWRASELPDAIKDDFSHGKLTRLESKNPETPKAKIGPIAKYELAKLLDVDLRVVDPKAADEYEAIVATLGGPPSTWRNASSVPAESVAA